VGGDGSTRWSMTLTRQTTDELLQLDVRALVRSGALQPGIAATVTWDGGASITIHRPSGGPARLMLAYGTWTRHGQWGLVEESVQLTVTPCMFGGWRTWFTCPGCESRCAVLYGGETQFRCRKCHQLVYASTRG
jgi:hypothetical protein